MYIALIEDSISNINKGLIKVSLMFQLILLHTNLRKRMLLPNVRKLDALMSIPIVNRRVEKLIRTSRETKKGWQKMLQLSDASLSSAVAYFDYSLNIFMATKYTTFQYLYYVELTVQM